MSTPTFPTARSARSTRWQAAVVLGGVSAVLWSLSPAPAAEAATALPAAPNTAPTYTAPSVPTYTAPTYTAPTYTAPRKPDPHSKDKWGDDTTLEGKKASTWGATPWDSTKDLGSLNSFTTRTSIQDLWSKLDALGLRLTGSGVTVAVIDTGVTPVAGLSTAGKVVNGPDLSFDGQAAGTRYLDGFGHGTHMAGIIAGRDASVAPGAEKGTKSFVGVAPGAEILNMKVAAADGGSDVTQIIAAIDWTVQHRRDQGMNVRVINLSYGTHSTQSAGVDPLARAVENAWRAGIVVVTAAGNDGTAAPLLMPAADPYVLSVGAVDHMGTLSTSDDMVASFSNGGTSARRPDVLAPGKSVVSLRVPGSYIDVSHPEGLVPGDTTGRFFRGSGTSQAAAVVSGEVALLLQARPYLTPDQVKAVLRASADPLATFAQPGMGAGVVDIRDAILTPVPLNATQSWPLSTGLGTLEASRGGEHVVDPTSRAVLGTELDALGSAWSAKTWSQSSGAGSAWNGGSWNGRVWAGTTWTTTGWAPVVWSGKSWTGADWSRHTWSSDVWDAWSWRSVSWEARSWRADSWEAWSWRMLI